MNGQTKIKYSYVCILPPGMSIDAGSSKVRISHNDSTLKQFLDQLCTNSHIKDEHGEIVSHIIDVNYEVIE